MRVDMHVHTGASFDCRDAPEAVAAQAGRLGLAPLFVTDHDTVEGAFRLRDQGFPVVVGEEIMTAEGEVVGLFLQSQVQPGLTAVETVSRIKDQGGIVYLEHPFDRRRRALSEEAVEAILDKIDIVEVYNGRSTADLNARAEDLRAAIGAAPGVGSDAHAVRELGHCYVEVAAFDGGADFLEKLREARIVTRAAPWRMRAAALAARWR